MALKKTVLTVVVLHEDHVDARSMSLERLAQEMHSGDLVGRSTVVSSADIAPGTEVAQMLMVGNDGSFFEVGEQVEEGGAAGSDGGQDLGTPQSVDDDRYGVVGWSVGDVMSLAPRLSEEQARTWAEGNSKFIVDRMIERGWDVLEALMRSDGIDLTEEDEQPAAEESGGVQAG